MSRLYNCKEITDFYLKAALRTSASKTERPDAGCLPGSMQYRYSEGDSSSRQEEGALTYLDVFDQFAGFNRGITSIYAEYGYGDMPVFHMSYLGGCYCYDSIAGFHKMALRSAYEDNLFLGGRGPKHFVAPQEYVDMQGLVYTNRLLKLPERVTKVAFAFSGIEEVSGPPGVLYWLKYEGLVLGSKQ